jgi:uncharacterized protein YqjF (DUF2071 family)
VRRATQLHRWEQLAFLHWPFPPAVVRPFLPDGLEIDEHDGRAWVGLIPFRLRIRVPGVPYLPWAGRFVETNVRTYVRGPDGTPGIWFFSLDAQRVGAVAVARASWSLPYMWARMELTRTGDTITYASRRRWPRATDGGDITSRVRLRIGAAIDPENVDELDHFLTARWALFSSRHAELSRTTALHAPWPLRSATVLEWDDHLLTAAGLPPSTAPPRVLFSEGVDVRLAPRQLVPRTTASGRPQKYR